MNQEFRLKKTDEIRKCLIEEINQTELMSKKNKKVCKVLNYAEHWICNYWMCFHFCFCFFSWNFSFLIGIHPMQG